MSKNTYDDRSIVADMMAACTGLVEQPLAIKALRGVCRYFGGQLIYIPMSKTTGTTTQELYGVLVDEVGEAIGEKILDKIMILFGGHQIYIPMEIGAFRSIIAQEIYERLGNVNNKNRDLCREYNMSFTQIYRLWHEARDNKKQIALNFEGE